MAACTDSSLTIRPLNRSRVFTARSVVSSNSRKSFLTSLWSSLSTLMASMCAAYPRGGPVMRREAPSPFFRLRHQALVLPLDAQPAVAVAAQRQVDRRFGEILATTAQEVVEGDDVVEAIQLEADAAGLGGEVVGGHHRRSVPVATMCQHGPGVGLDDAPPAETQLRRLPAPPDQALEPVEERLRVATLRGDVDGQRAELALGQRHGEPPGIRRREAGTGFIGPLHRRAHGQPFVGGEDLAHADLLPVEED